MLKIIKKMKAGFRKATFQESFISKEKILEVRHQSF
jgi:hypothetical protein